MSAAAIYDVHGNLAALDAALADAAAARPDVIVVGGDVVPGPQPRECLARLRALGTPVLFIRGNGERVVLAAREGRDIPEVPAPYRAGIHWNAAQIDNDMAEWISSWPPSVLVPVGARTALFCHATPRNDTDIITSRTPEGQVARVLAGVQVPLVVCGHTHMQYEREIGAIGLVNAGSVGMPFQPRGAYWALIGADVQLRRSTYDYDAAAARVRATAYPQAEDFAARNILDPPSEQQMLEAFGKVPLAFDP